MIILSILDSILCALNFEAFDYIVKLNAMLKIFSHANSSIFNMIVAENISYRF